MRANLRNKQKMYCSLYIGEVPVYELDEDGNPIVEYITDEGVVIYRDTGTKKPIYGKPFEIWASISSKLNELHARAYGVDQSSVYSEIMVEKNIVKLEYGTKIWKNSPIQWEDEESGRPNVDSSDYTVKGILDEFLNFDWFLLQRNNHGEN